MGQSVPRVTISLLVAWLNLTIFLYQQCFSLFCPLFPWDFKTFKTAHQVPTTKQHWDHIFPHSDAFTEALTCLMWHTVRLLNDWLIRWQHERVVVQVFLIKWSASVKLYIQQCSVYMLWLVVRDSKYSEQVVKNWKINKFIPFTQRQVSFSTCVCVTCSWTRFSDSKV